MKVSRNRVRRSPHLVSYWDGGRLTLMNFCTGVAAEATPVAIEVLSFFGRWRPRAELRRAMPSAPPDLLELVVNRLIECSFLEGQGSRSRAEPTLKKWKHWNPAAGFFHYATRDVPYVDPAAKKPSLASTRVRRPPLVKRLSGVATTHLPRSYALDSFTNTLLGRRTWRDFGDGPLTKDELATLLNLTGGVQRWEMTLEGRAPLKTSPSGGATHPGELYVLALNVKGLKRGIYHYRADNHTLELVRSRGSRADVERYLPTQWWYRRAAALVFFTAVFARSMWRYRSARAYRALLIEAGHQCQTFCLTATWLGLAPFCSMALADSAIEDDLGISSDTESVLYAAGVGRRPAGVEWAPAPRDADWLDGPSKVDHRPLASSGNDSKRRAKGTR